MPRKVSLLGFESILRGESERVALLLLFRLLKLLKGWVRWKLTLNFYCLVILVFSCLIFWITSSSSSISLPFIYFATFLDSTMNFCKNIWALVSLFKIGLWGIWILSSNSSLLYSWLFKNWSENTKDSWTMFVSLSTSDGAFLNCSKI